LFSGSKLGAINRRGFLRAIFDSHLDLAWNALSYNRDLTLEISELRRREAGMTDAPARGHNTVTLPELRRAGVRVCVGTLLARSGPEQVFKPMYKRMDVDYATPTIASATAMGQLAYYELLEQQHYIRLLRTGPEFVSHWNADDPRLGVIISMEGTDPILNPEQLQYWWDRGLRVAGLAHFGRGRHAYGTRSDGPLSEEGIALLKEFKRLGMILDVTHLCDRSMSQAMDLFDGPVLASHHNCRAIVPGDRQLSDEQILRLISRGGVIGAALDAAMIVPGWERGKSSPESVGLTDLVKHIEHVCQLAGNARHAAIGSDLDGGWGTEQTPGDMDTVADLQKLGDLLSGRGFKDSEIEGIFFGNWLGFFVGALPG
jgi:membrane dipeptidase